MQAKRAVSKNRPLPAILAAMGITLLMGVVLAVLGANALLNQGVPLLQAPADAQAAGVATGVATATTDASAGQIQELTAQYQAREQEYQAREKQYADLVKQYQSREQQYTQQLQQAVQERNAAQVEAQQYQQTLVALQQAGIIQIGPDGQIFLAQPGRHHDDHD